MKSSSSRMHARLRLSLILATAAVLLVLLPATVATAVFTPTGTATTSDASAGAHPNFTTLFTQSANSAAALSCVGAACAIASFPEPDVKTVVQTLPRGLMPNPKATAYCNPTSTDLAVPTTVQWSCQEGTQIGTETITVLVCGEF